MRATFAHIIQAAKNLTLAGVGSITLLSNELCVSASPCNFLIPADAPDDATVSGASARTLQAMNPLIQVEASPAVTFQAQSMQGFDVVIACGLSLQQAVDLDAQCSATGARVFVADIHGPSSYVFANLHSHTYTVKVSAVTRAVGACILATHA